MLPVDFKLLVDSQLHPQYVTYPGLFVISLQLGGITTDLATPLTFAHHSRPLVSQHCMFCGLPRLWSSALQEHFHFVKSMSLNYSAVGTYVFPASPFC